MTKCMPIGEAGVSHGLIGVWFLRSLLVICSPEVCVNGAFARKME